MNVAELTPVRPQVPVARRRRWVSILLALVIFGSGCIAGGAAALLIVRNRIREAVRHPELAPTMVANVLRRKLALDEEQTQAVEAILRTRHEAFRRQMHPRATAELQRVEKEVAEVLTPAQQTKWEALLDEWRSNWVPPPPSAE